MMEEVSVCVESPLQGEVAALLQQSDAVSARLYPGGHRHPLEPESLNKASTYLLVARLAGKAVGLCAIVERGGAEVELKRMIVDAQARERGVGAALVRGATTEARRLGARVIVLEVGVRNIEAQALYRKAGFVDREQFPPHAALPVSLFMEADV